MTVLSLIEEQIKKNASKKIINFDTRELSYQELKQEYEKMSSYLFQMGVRKGDIVGLCVQRSIEMVTALLAILRCGAVYLPIDPNLPAHRIKLMIEDSNCKFLITEENLFGEFGNFTGKLIDVNHFIENTNIDEIPDSNDENNLAYIIYTSGSTGIPKGVQILQASLTNLLTSVEELIGVNDEDSLLAISTLSFDISLVELLLPLISGAKLVIANNEEVREGRLLLNKLQKNVTVFQATPATWKMLIDTGWNEKLNIKAISTGESLPRDLADNILSRVDILWNMYGPTETTIFSSGGKVSEGKNIHLGKPIRNTLLYIVDKNNQLCAPGVPGELLIGGSGLSIGYLNRDNLTKEKFIDNPFDKEKKTKVYKTGDLVKINNEYQIEYLGRIDDQVKIRGYRIEPGEIESTIRKNEFIKDCAVVVKNVLDDKKLVAFYTMNTDTKSDQNTSEIIVDNWKNKWSFLYESEIDKIKNDKPDENYNLDQAITVQLAKDQTSIDEEINEWLNQTVARIKELDPSRLLEIGCGGGQLLKKVADNCEFVAGTDLVEPSIKILKKQLEDKKERFPQFKLLALPADADLPFERNFFDTIVINSVTQYFPDVEYLLKVINKSLEYLSDDGCLYIGDVQSYKLLRNYHLNDQLNHISQSETVSQLLKLVDRRVQQEEELVVDPDFFYSLDSINPRISRIEVKLRKGRRLNETTQYHYDVFIFLKKSEVSESDDVQLFWGKNIHNLNDLKEKLCDNFAGYLFVNDIPNKRISDNLEREQLLSLASPEEDLASVINSLRTNQNHIDPEDLWNLAQELDLKAELFLPGNSNLVEFDAVFYKGNDSYRYNIRRSDIDYKLLKDFSNKPADLHFHQKITEQLRTYLEERLPAYMVPAFIIPLESLPLTPNNKIDKKTLSSYDLTGTLSSKKIVDPVTVTEKQLVKIWEKLLSISGIGIEDNFFELGGHSILAAQMFTEIERETEKRIPIATLFKLQTIRELAALIDSPEWAPDWSTVIEIKKGKKNTPLYLIHGAEGNILMYRELAKYLDEDQTLYGIQSPGLNGQNVHSRSIEEMSTDYIKAIKSVQPEGPYSLGGYCMGGTIAFEIAQQLHSLGDKVQLLLLLETYNICISPYTDSTVSKIKAFGENIIFHTVNLFSLHGSDRIAFFRSKLAVAQSRIRTRINQIQQKIFHPFEKNQHNSSKVISVTSANHSALIKYKPSLYIGKTILLKPAKNFSAEPDPDFGWRNLVKGEFKVYNLNLAPRGMLVEPYVINTAAIITEEMRS